MVEKIYEKWFLEAGDIQVIQNKKKYQNMEKFVLDILGRLWLCVGSWVGFTNHTEPILLPSYPLSNTNLQVNYGPDNIGMKLIKKYVFIMLVKVCTFIFSENLFMLWKYQEDLMSEAWTLTSNVMNIFWKQNDIELL